MQQAASRMDRMLTSLLEYSRLDTRARSIEKVSLNEVLD
jgi:signal transduction histidine kinase